MCRLINLFKCLNNMEFIWKKLELLTARLTGSCLVSSSKVCKPIQKQCSHFMVVFSKQDLRIPSLHLHAIDFSYFQKALINLILRQRMNLAIMILYQIIFKNPPLNLSCQIMFMKKHILMWTAIGHCCL